MWECISGLFEHVGWEFNSGLIFPALYCLTVAGNCRSTLALHPSAGAAGALGAMVVVLVPWVLLVVLLVPWVLPVLLVCCPRTGE